MTAIMLKFTRIQKFEQAGRFVRFIGSQFIIEKSYRHHTNKETNRDKRGVVCITITLKKL